VELRTVSSRRTPRSGRSAPCLVSFTSRVTVGWRSDA
jgi:hypothetical protein